MRNRISAGIRQCLANFKVGINEELAEQFGLVAIEHAEADLVDDGLACAAADLEEAAGAAI